MIPWQYTDASQTVVYRTTDNGGMESCLVTVPEVQAWIAAGNTPLPVPGPSPAERQASAVSAVQKRLDEAARARGYDDILSAITYADDPTVPRFQADGIAFRSCRSMTWATCYQIQAKIAAGEIVEPTLEEFLAMLPTLPIFAD